MMKLFANYFVLLNLALFSAAEARGSFCYPVENPYVTSGFQPARRHPTLGIVRPHKGVDFRAPTGTNIFASCNGKIEVAKWSQSFGNVIFIVHRIAGKIYRTVYAHLSSFVHGLKSGMRVLAGQLLGKSGSTGYASGPHLHFELHEGDRAVDPIPYLRGKKVGSSRKKKQEAQKHKGKKFKFRKSRSPKNKNLSRKQERKLLRRFNRLYTIVLQRKAKKGIFSRWVKRDNHRTKVDQKRLNKLEKRYPKLARKARRNVQNRLHKSNKKSKKSWLSRF